MKKEDEERLARVDSFPESAAWGSDAAANELTPSPVGTVWIVRQGNGLRGVHDSQAGAEREIADICRWYPDLSRQDFIVQVERVRRTVGDCAYQDVACWDRQLRAAGWLPVSARTGREVPGATVWRSPNGSLYRGPYGAWKAMKDAAGERTNDAR